MLRHYFKDLATTYSRGSYTTTTIGNAAFDCRVRDGIGSDRSFIVTKKSKNICSLKTTHRKEFSVRPIIF